MAVPIVPGLVGSSAPATTILSRTARSFTSYQHPTVEKALQARSELPKRRDVVWSAVVLILSLALLGLSYSGETMMKLARSRAVSELMQIMGWQGLDEGLLLLAFRIAFALLSLIYAASLYFFLKLYTTATVFSVPAPPPSGNQSINMGQKQPLLSTEQLALLFPKQAPKALAKLPDIVQSVKETPSHASHLASSLLKKTKIVLHDAASSAAHRLGRSNAADDAPPQSASDTEPNPQPPPTKPESPAPFLAPLHPEIQKPTGGSSLALWGSGGKEVTDGTSSGGGTLPGKATPAFESSSFVPTSPFSPVPLPLNTQPVTPPTQNMVTPTNNPSGSAGVSVRDRSFTPLQSEEALDDFLADLDRRMETPTPQSPRFGPSPEPGANQTSDAGFQSLGPMSPGTFSLGGARAGSGYFAEQVSTTANAPGTGMYPQTPAAASPIFGAPAQTTPQPTGFQQQGPGPVSSPYNLSTSPPPYAPSAPPLSALPQQSPVGGAVGTSPSGTNAYGAAASYQQSPYSTHQSPTPSPYSVSTPAYGAQTPPAYGPYSSPYNQSPGGTAPGQYTLSPSFSNAYPMTPPSAYNQPSNLSATPGSPYPGSPYPFAAPSPLQGAQAALSASPLPPSGRSFTRSSPSQPKPGVTIGVKADREMPSPMPPEVIERRLKGLGISSRELDAWRDELRVWFAEKLLAPLVRKMDASPSKVRNACTALNMSLPVTLSPLGTDSRAVEAAAAVTSVSLAVPAAPSEETVLKMLGEKLEEERKKAMQPAAPAPTTMFGQPQAAQQRPSLPSIQACLDAVTENQRLRLLLRGELVPRVLPLPTVQPTFVARRIRELAEGACVRRFDWSGGGDVIPGQQPWTAAANLPSDAHLLFYLFTAFLEFPGWSLHQEPLTGPGHQGGFFFMGDIPSRHPEQFVAILQPPLSAELRAFVRQPKATVVLVGKQSPAPVFYLLWGGKFQFVLQGRTAIWDVIALLTYRLRQSHEGAIRGISLNSSTIDLPPVIQPA
ncbi:hypothetical protein KFL_009710020 [Klebsormidium nitens]|uniref:Transmembrane protein n=1 Tax=Klebsormidium nitens TaxID=105231 RepID=A0A1Y1IN38_KLENI|nr:hypothetical protein KFL_009710020 [Klebsormidium nitens]|eukprot:GAQ92300.1 hypothetical protein KFL_009710020 [Klebsormidium nitens]